MNEVDWQAGNRAAFVSMLDTCLRALGRTNDEAARLAWVVEREQAIAMLRLICEDHGDNDWDARLHLADILEKHLARHLEGHDAFPEQHHPPGQCEDGNCHICR